MRRPFLLLALLAATSGCSDSSDAPVANRPRHVLLISIDTLRADRLGCYGHTVDTSPQIDRLASEGMLFEQAQAPRGATWPTLTTLLTGKYPISHGVRTNHVLPADGMELLSHRFKQAGYATGAFMSNYDEALVDPEATGAERTKRAAVRGFDVLMRGRQPGVGHERADRRVTQAAIDWLEQQAEGPTFTWVHLMNPHRPYDIIEESAELLTSHPGWMRDEGNIRQLLRAMERGALDLDQPRLEKWLNGKNWRTQLARTYGEVIRSKGGAIVFDQLLDMITIAGVELDDEELAYILSRYDAEIRSTDYRVGEILATLDRLGIADETLVVFTSDHGDEMYDRQGYFFHAASIYQGVLHVPLVVRWPGRVQPGRRAEVVEISDLAPTLVDAVELEPLPGVEGVSFRPLLEGKPGYEKTIAIAELYHSRSLGREENAAAPFDSVYAVRDARWKLLINRSGAHPRTPPYVAYPDMGFRIQVEELYDLQADRGEQHNLLAPGPADGSRSPLARAHYLAEAYRARTALTRAFEEWLAGVVPGESQAPVPEDLTEGLAALGYVEADPVEAAPAEVARQPAEALLRAVITAAERATQDEASAADALLLLAEAELWRGDSTRARDLAQRALERAGDRAAVETQLRALGLR